MARLPPEASKLPFVVTMQPVLKGVHADTQAAAADADDIQL